MPRPTSRPGTANRMYRRRIPEDAIRILDRLPDDYRPAGWGRNEIILSLGTSDVAWLRPSTRVSLIKLKSICRD